MTSVARGAPPEVTAQPSVQSTGLGTWPAPTPVEAAPPAPVAVALLLFGVCQPTSGLLVKRILLSREAFPAKTTVVDVTADVQVDEGGEASLTARATGEIPPDGRLVVTHLGRPPEIIPVTPSTAGADDCF